MRSYLLPLCLLAAAGCARPATTATNYPEVRAAAEVQSALPSPTSAAVAVQPTTPMVEVKAPTPSPSQEAIPSLPIPCGEEVQLQIDKLDVKVPQGTLKVAGMVDASLTGYVVHLEGVSYMTRHFCPNEH